MANLSNFSLDCAVRLQEELERERKIKRLIEIEEIRSEAFIPQIVPIPYTPPKTVWSYPSWYAFMKSIIII